MTISKLYLHQRAATYYSLRPLKENPKNIQDLENILLAFTHHIAAGDHEEAAGMLLKIDDQYLYKWGHYKRLFSMWSDILDSKIHRQTVVKKYARLGVIQYGLGRYEDSVESLLHALQLSDTSLNLNTGDIQRQLGLSYHRLRDFERAIICYNHATEIAEEQADIVLKAKILFARGLTFRAKAQSQDAKQAFEDSLKLLEAHPDEDVIPRILNSIGEIHAAKVETDAAMDMYEKALKKAIDQENIILQNMIKSNLSKVMFEQGNITQARQYVQETLQAAQETGHRRGEAIRTYRLGEIELEQGNFELAESFFNKADQIFEDLKADTWRKASLSGLGYAQYLRGEIQQGLQTLQTADSLENKSFARQQLFIRLAQIYLMTKDLDEANSYSSAATKINRSRSNERAWLVNAITLWVSNAPNELVEASLNRTIEYSHEILSQSSKYYSAMFSLAIATTVQNTLNGKSTPNPFDILNSALEICSAKGMLKDLILLLEPCKSMQDHNGNITSIINKLHIFLE